MSDGNDVIWFMNKTEPNSFNETVRMKKIIDWLRFFNETLWMAVERDLWNVNDCWTRLMECESLAETEGILTINFFNYWEIQKKLVNMNDSNEFICVAKSDWM